MIVSELITESLAELNLPIAESLYEGDADEYITFNKTDDTGADFGDNDPGTNVIYMHIHYVCPWLYDYHPTCRRIRNILKNTGFTWPEVTDVSDEATRMRHIAFECAIENDYDLREE